MKNLVRLKIAVQVTRPDAIGFAYSLAITPRDRLKLAEVVINSKDLLLQVKTGIVLLEMTKSINDIKNKVSTLETAI